MRRGLPLILFAMLACTSLAAIPTAVAAKTTTKRPSLSVKGTYLGKSLTGKVKVFLTTCQTLGPTEFTMQVAGYIGKRTYPVGINLHSPGAGRFDPSSNANVNVVVNNDYQNEPRWTGGTFSIKSNLRTGKLNLQLGTAPDHVVLKGRVSCKKTTTPTATGATSASSVTAAPTTASPPRPVRDYPGGGPTEAVFPPGINPYTLVASGMCQQLLDDTLTWDSQNESEAQGSDTTRLYMSAAYVCLGQWDDAIRVFDQISTANPQLSGANTGVEDYSCARNTVLQWLSGLIAERKRNHDFSPVFVTSGAPPPCQTEGSSSTEPASTPPEPASTPPSSSTTSTTPRSTTTTD
jgi:hypothetical protein